MTQFQQIEGYKSQAKRAFENLLTDSPETLLNIVNELDTKVWEALNAMPNTAPEGVEIDTFGYWDINDDRKESDFYRIKHRLFEVKKVVTDYYQPGHPDIEIWDTPGRIDLLTMLQILAHDRAVRPEAYQTQAQ